MISMITNVEPNKIESINYVVIELILVFLLVK